MLRRGTSPERSRNLIGDVLIPAVREFAGSARAGQSTGTEFVANMFGNVQTGLSNVSDARL